MIRKKALEYFKKRKQKFPDRSEKQMALHLEKGVLICQDLAEAEAGVKRDHGRQKNSEMPEIPW